MVAGLLREVGREDRHPVDDIQRFVAGRDGAGTADVHHHGSARCSRSLRDLHAADASAERLLERRGGGLPDRGGIDRADGARQFAPFLLSVGYDDLHLAQLRSVRLQLDVHGGGGGDLFRSVADEGDDERGAGAWGGQAEVSVDVAHRACRRALDYNVCADHRLAVVLTDDGTADRH